MPSTSNTIIQHSCDIQQECNSRAAICFIEQYFSNNLQAIVRPNKTKNDIPSPKKRKPDYQLTGRENQKPYIQITGREKLQGKKSHTKQIQYAYKSSILKTCNVKAGCLWADIKFKNTKRVLAKKQAPQGEVSVFTNWAHSRIVLKSGISLLEDNTFEDNEFILLPNIHEHADKEFWNISLGSYPTRQFFKVGKLQYNQIERYYPKQCEEYQKKTSIHIVNKGQTSAPKRSQLQSKFQTTNNYTTKNCGGRIVILRNELNTEERIGMALISILQTVVKPGGETKGNACRINGKPKESSIRRTCNVPSFLRSTGVSEGTRVEKVHISENGARMYYIGSKGVQTSFQCARFFSRHIFKSSKKHLLTDTIMKAWDANQQTLKGVTRQVAHQYIDAYLSKLQKIADEHYPYFMENYDPNSFWNGSLDLASNVVDSSVSKAHLHIDTTSLFPAILTAMNPNPAHPWKGGELFISNGACLINYSGGQKRFSDCGDVIIMDADQLAHSVLPILDDDNKNCKDLVRISHVLYNNGSR